MEDFFLASDVVPTRMQAIDPSRHMSVDFALQSLRDANSPRRPSEAAAGILGTCSEIFSRWFSIMRGAIGRERKRQAKLREELGLPKSAKLPYLPPSLTKSDKAIASLSEAVIRSLFGKSAADYARDKFAHAIATGDMRAFKIRLLVLKARDAILDHSLKADFSLGADDCIDQAEKNAGCIPDHSPRRLSRAEQARKKRLDAIREAKMARQKAQMELPLVWPEKEDAKNAQDIEKKDIPQQAGAASLQESDADDQAASSKGPISIYCTGSEIDQKNNGEYNDENLEDHESSKNDEVVTVTDKNVVSKKKRYCNITRKARDYTSVDEIMDDIEQNRIVPYGSLDEILDDVSNARLTQAEAMMFVAALDRYCPEVSDGTSFAAPASIDDEDGLERDELSDTEVDDPEGDEDDEAVYDDEEEGEDDELNPDEANGTGFSYNPNGFGGYDDEDDER